MNLIPTAASADDTSRVLDLLERARPKAGEADMRGFEWYYWKRWAHPEIAYFRPPVSAFGSSAWSVSLNMTTMSLSADGTRVAAFDMDGLRVWDVATKRPLTMRTDLRAPRVVKNDKYLYPRYPASGPVFSRDGRLVACVLADSLASDGTTTSRFAVVESDGGRVVYEAADQRRMDGRFAELMFDPVGRRITFFGGKRFNSNGWEFVAVHDIVNRRPFVESPSDDAATVKADVPASERLHVKSDGAGGFSVVETATRKTLWSKATGGSDHFDFSPDGTRLIEYTTAFSRHTAATKTFCLWDVSTGSLLPSPVRLTAGLLAARFRPDGRLVTLDQLGAVQTWDLSPSPPPNPEAAVELPSGGLQDNWDDHRLDIDGPNGKRFTIVRPMDWRVTAPVTVQVHGAAPRDEIRQYNLSIPSPSRLTKTAASNRYVRALKRLKEILAALPGFGSEPGS